MFAGLISFLGGSVFRMIWGEVSSFVTKRQDHQNEIEMMRVQAENEDKRQARDLERIRLQSNLKVTEVKVMGDLEVQKQDATAFIEAIRASSVPTGIQWVDAWNASVRPSYASVALLLWLFKIVNQGFVMDDFDSTLLATIAGFYFADRSLGKRGK